MDLERSFLFAYVEAGMGIGLLDAGEGLRSLMKYSFERAAWEVVTLTWSHYMIYPS